jgi:hypothetical protein
MSVQGVSILALIVIALLAVYVIGWRHGYAAGNHPHRRRTDPPFRNPGPG